MMPRPVQTPTQSNIVVAKAEITTGPLPPPEVLAKYNDVLPGAAERIIKMAEEQAQHRMSLEKMVIKSDIHRSWGGLVAGFVIAMALGGGGLLLTWAGHPEALKMSYTSLAVLVGAFIYATETRRRERAEKSKAMRGG